MADAPVPPSDLDAEEYVLGALLLAGTVPDALFEEGLAATDFYRGSHGLIFQAALSLFEIGEPIDAVTVTDRLDERGELDNAGGRQHVHELASIVPAVGNVGHYVRIVREMATLRALIAAGEKIARLGWERPGAAGELIERAQGYVFDLTRSRAERNTVSLREAIRETFARIEELHQQGKDVIGTPTGFIWLDKLTAGFQPGNLIILAARPSMGKTALALGIATNIAVRYELPVVIFTMEMNRGEVTQRLLSAESYVESQKIRTGTLGVEEWSNLTGAAARLDPAPITIDESASLTALELRSKARRIAMRTPNLALIVVDYLQLMTSGTRSENRNQDVSTISRTLKILAAELEIPILALSQLSRQVEQRHDKRPMLSDLRESGAIEQDSDVVLLLYRDDYYNEDPDDHAQRGVAELNVAKHRNGPTGVVRLSFTERFAKFANLQP